MQSRRSWRECPADDAERRLIDLYRDPETTKWGLVRFKGRDGLRQRLHQIQRARKHYDADEFDSCVLQLIAVMDGFVNDLQPDVRKGLASRDPDDMAAWDSVVGHHLGLTDAMATFRTTIKKRVDEEVSRFTGTRSCTVPSSTSTTSWWPRRRGPCSCGRRLGERHHQSRPTARTATVMA